MVNFVTNIAFVIFATLCVTSSLPVGEEVKESTENFVVTTEILKESVASTEAEKIEDKKDMKVETQTEEIKEKKSEENEGNVKNKNENSTEKSENEVIENEGPIRVSETLIPIKTNGSKDVYVIKTIVYEVGILTEADDNKLNDTESHEEINLTFFDAKHNDSTIDLSNIPIPIQTNISGVSVTGVAPANFGTIHLPEGDKPATLQSNFPLPIPILPNAVISVKHNISTTNVDNQTQLLSSLPSLLQLTSPITGEPLKVEKPTSEKEDLNSSEESSEESKEDSKESREDKKS